METLYLLSNIRDEIDNPEMFHSIGDEESLEKLRSSKGYAHNFWFYKWQLKDCATKSGPGRKIVQE